MGLGRGQRHQLAHGLGGHLGVHHHQRGRVADHADELELRNGVVAQLLQRGAHAVGADVAEQDGVPVGCRTGHLFGRNGAIGPGLVLHDDLLAQQGGELDGHDARHAVIAAPCGGGHDQRDGLVGIGRVGGASAAVASAVRRVVE